MADDHPWNRQERDRLWWLRQRVYPKLTWTEFYNRRFFPRYSLASIMQEYTAMKKAKARESPRKATAKASSKTVHPPPAKRPVSTVLQLPRKDQKRQRSNKDSKTAAMKRPADKENTEEQGIAKGNCEGSVLSPSSGDSGEETGHLKAKLRNKIFLTPHGQKAHETAACIRSGPSDKSRRNRLFSFDSDSDSNAARDTGSPRSRGRVSGSHAAVRKLLPIWKKRNLKPKHPNMQYNHKSSSTRFTEPIDLTLTSPATAPSTQTTIASSPEGLGMSAATSLAPSIPCTPTKVMSSATIEHPPTDQPDLAAVSTSLHNVVKSILPKAQALRDLHVTNAPNVFRRNPEINYLLEGLEHESVAEHCKQKLAAIEAAHEAMRCLKRVEKLDDHTKRVRELRETFENSQALKIIDVTDLISIISRDIARCKDWKEL